MFTRIAALVFVLPFIGCSSGSSLMTHYEISGEDKQLVERFSKVLNTNDAKAFIERESFNIDLPDKKGRTLLIASVLSENYKTTEKLLKLGANPNLIYPNYKSKSVMGWAASYKDSSYLQLLLQYGGDLSLLNEKQRLYPYPIYNSIAVDNVENLRFLLDNGANLNVVDKTGLTPIMLAATAGKWEMIVMMLEAGADISFKNNWNEDAASYIEDAGLGTSGEPNQWRKKIAEFYEQEGITLNFRVPL